MRSPKSDLEALRKVQKAFTARTANEIYELFAKVEATGPTWQETGSLRESDHLPSMVVSHYLETQE